MRPRWTNWNVNSNSGEANSPSLMTLMERQGRPLLDYEALTSLLTLLFIDEPKFNTLRLHRVIRNLCCHVPTREWIIKALLSIIERCNCSTGSGGTTTCGGGGGSGVTSSSSIVAVRPQWLNIRLNAALGSRANVFVIKKDLTQQQTPPIPPEGVPSTSAGLPCPPSTSGYIVSIHSQASQIVCKHTLDLLITLAKSFPKNFLPYKKQTTTTATTTKNTTANTTATVPLYPQQQTTTATESTNLMEPEKNKKLQNASNASISNSMAVDNCKPVSGTSVSSSSSTETSSSSNDFWKIIVKLDCTAPQRKASGPLGSSKQQQSATNSSPSTSAIHMSASNKDIVTFDESPFGQLISMLSFDIVRKSSQLTDKLLRLLSFISVALPDEKVTLSTSSTSSSNSTANANVNNQNAAAAAATDVSNSSSSISSNIVNGDSVVNEQRMDEQNIDENHDSVMNNSSTTTTVSAPSTNESLLPNSEDQLRLAIEVLTSKSCSEEGLEDATSLLLNMSQCSNQTRTIILNLLIRGAKDLAKMVQQQIKDLMIELKKLNHKSDITAASGSSTLSPPSGEISPEDLPLLGGSSSSSCTAGPSTSSHLLGKDSNNMSKPKGMLQDRFTRENVVITAPSKVKQTCELQLSSMVPLISKTSSQGFFLRVLKVIIQIREAVREANSKVENRGRIVLGPNELTPLSETLDLDDLWDTLSECLLELEETADNHAVLVLQPAVEAFFLVHASTQQKSLPLSSLSSRQEHSADVNVPAGAGVGQSSSSLSSYSIQNSRLLNPENSESNRILHQYRIATVAPTAVSILNNISDTNSPRPMQQDDDDNNDDLSLPFTNPITTADTNNIPTTSGLQQEQQTTTITSSSTSSSITTTSTTVKQHSVTNSDQKKFLQFAEKHRTVLNQILRQTTTHLADGPFAVLVDHTRILDFDVKRRYFRTELERLDEGIRREELAVHVHRVTVFEDSFRELYRRNPEEWKNRFYIVFEGKFFLKH